MLMLLVLRLHSLLDWRIWILISTDENVTFASDASEHGFQFGDAILQRCDAISL
jgi:hypothetical protein